VIFILERKLFIRLNIGFIKNYIDIYKPPAAYSTGGGDMTKKKTKKSGAVNRIEAGVPELGFKPLIKIPDQG